MRVFLEGCQLATRKYLKDYYSMIKLEFFIIWVPNSPRIEN